MVKERLGQLGHILISEELPLDLRMRLYIGLLQYYDVWSRGLTFRQRDLQNDERGERLHGIPHYR